LIKERLRILQEKEGEAGLLRVGKETTKGHLISIVLLEEGERKDKLVVKGKKLLGGGGVAGYWERKRGERRGGNVNSRASREKREGKRTVSLKTELTEKKEWVTGRLAIGGWRGEGIEKRKQSLELRLDGKKKKGKLRPLALFFQRLRGGGEKKRGKDWQNLKKKRERRVPSILLGERKSVVLLPEPRGGVSEDSFPPLRKEVDEGRRKSCAGEKMESLPKRRGKAEIQVEERQYSGKGKRYILSL